MTLSPEVAELIRDVKALVKLIEEKVSVPEDDEEIIYVGKLRQNSEDFITNSKEWLRRHYGGMWILVVDGAIIASSNRRESIEDYLYAHGTEYDKASAVFYRVPMDWENKDKVWPSQIRSR